MGTIANHKNGSTIQLEFQAIGTSEASIMLQQPLLGTTTDGYTVEVTQLMMSLGDERATSGNEFIMAIVERPNDNTYIDLDNYHTRVNSGTPEIDAWVALIDAQPMNAYTFDDVESIPNKTCYSATDFIYALNQSLGNATLSVELKVGVSPSGQLSVIGTDDFWETYMVLVGPVLKALSGWGDIIYAEEDSEKLRTGHAGTVNMPAFVSVPARPRIFYAKKNESAWEIFDRRKRIRIDLTIPVGLTLGWKDTKEVTKYSIQEFYLPHGDPQAIYEDLDNVTIKQEQLVGTTNLVDGGGKLAIKRLFPGPVQALRLSLILIYEYFDPLNKVWVEREKPVSMSSGDFFYLKLQFNKDTT